jgi:HlyD family secretion protein
MDKKRMSMSQIFPPEIIKESCENYFSEQNSSGSAIYLAAILFLLVAACLLPVVKVQVTSQSDGIVRSVYEDNPIVPAVTGEVIYCKMSENLAVHKSDTLLIIASHRIDQQLRLFTFKEKEEETLVADLSKLIIGNWQNLTTALCKQEYQTFSGKLAEQKTALIQAERDYLLAEKLYGKGITPRYELEKLNNAFLLENNRYSSLLAQQQTLWQGRLKETIIRLADITSEIEQMKKEKMDYCLLAPISGTITGFNGIKTGNFLLPNQLIAKISPDNELMVECYVSPSDIGLIEKGMEVSFQFHAYNYNQWGVASGLVHDISSNVANINSAPYFRVKCKLAQSYLQLKNGTRGNLKKGMTLTGRFKVAERTLFQLLYDKADNWLNPKLNNG